VTTLNIHAALGVIASITYVVVVDAGVIAHGADGRQFHQTIELAALHLLAAGKPATREITVSKLATASVIYGNLNVVRLN